MISGETPEEISEISDPSNSKNDYDYEYNSEKYKISKYIECSEIVFKIEIINANPVKLFTGSFSIEKLIAIDKYFKSADTIEDALSLVEELLNENEYSINKKNDDLIELIFPFLKRTINIPLKKDKIEKDLTYNSLSDEMKKIIDNNDLILGIDLGTTYSCAAVMIDENIIVIENSLGLTTTPSYVSFFGPYERCVGELAKLRPSNEGNIIFNSKRLLDKNINDKEIIDIKNDLPFTIKEDTDYNKLKIKIKFNEKDNQEFYPEQISAMILKKIVNDSEYYLSKIIGKKIKINKAVITVPAYFNQKQREATEQASKIIGLNVERMINEPTAASLAYGFKSLGNNKKNIIVIDFGGGTLDITLLKFIKNNNGIYCDIKSSYGDSNFGGEDFDYILMKECINSLNCEEKNYDKKLPCNIRLKRACERAKIKLSKCESTNIIIEEYIPNKNINFHITKNEFEKYCSNLFEKFEKILNDFLNDYDVDKKDISEVLLIGGSTLIPKIQNIIKNTFNDSEIKNNLNPNEAVAKGAAILGGILSNLSCVNKINLLDVTNLSLGINQLGDKLSTIIKRSTPIPNESEKIYKTCDDDQTEAAVEIYEGIKKEIKDNLYLGKFIIKNLPKKKAGMVKVKVIFRISYDSILKVKAYELENEQNFKELEIEKPQGLMNIMKTLIKEEKKMKDIDLKEYNEIKDSILELEENIKISKKADEINFFNEKIIEKLGGFILKILKKKDIEYIIISYIKYYFKKISKYLDIKNDFINNNGFRTNLKSILEEIQFYKPELILEIIECFVDYNELYNICLKELINYYFEKISHDFYGINILIKNKKKSKLKEGLETLSKIKLLIDSALCFCEKLKDIDKEQFLIHSLKESINDFKIKIEVKEKIIKNLEKKFNQNEIIELNDLIEKYKKCKTAEIADLIELEKINNKSIKNIDEVMEKADNFLYNFNKFSNDDAKKFHFIFDKYNPDEEKYNETILYDFEYSYTQKQQEEFLTEICGVFQKLEKDTTPSKRKDAYTAINIYLNKLKEKNSKQTLFHK